MRACHSSCFCGPGLSCSFLVPFFFFFLLAFANTVLLPPSFLSFLFLPLPSSSFLFYSLSSFVMLAHRLAAGTLFASRCLVNLARHLCTATAGDSEPGWSFPSTRLSVSLPGCVCVCVGCVCVCVCVCGVRDRYPLTHTHSLSLTLSLTLTLPLGVWARLQGAFGRDGIGGGRGRCK